MRLHTNIYREALKARPEATATHSHCTAEHKQAGNDVLQSSRVKHPDCSRYTKRENW